MSEHDNDNEHNSPAHNVYVGTNPFPPTPVFRVPEVVTRDVESPPTKQEVRDQAEANYRKRKKNWGD